MGIDAEFFDNPQPRCAVVLLLDNSGSMIGEPISQLNTCVEKFKKGLEKDVLASQRVEVAVVTFGHTVSSQDFVPIHQFIPPVLQVQDVLKLGETTPMGSAIHLALDMLAIRKDDYKNHGVPYFCPWVLLITDGVPTDPCYGAAQRIWRAEDDGEVTFLAIGVQNANMNILTQTVPKNRPPALWSNLNFESLYSELSLYAELRQERLLFHQRCTDDAPPVTLSPPTWGIV